MPSNSSKTFNLHISGSESLWKINEDLLATTSNAIRVHVSIEIDECPAYVEPISSKKQVYEPALLFSDVLLTLFNTFSSMRDLFIEGYQLNHHSHGYMIHDPATHGVFYQFQQLADDFLATGELDSIPQFQNIETMEFKRCLLNEHDLQILSSSMFGNLRKVSLSDCTPTDSDVREKYVDFIPGCEWDDKYCSFEDERGLKNKEYY